MFPLIDLLGRAMHHLRCNLNSKKNALYRFTFKNIKYNGPPMYTLSLSTWVDREWLWRGYSYVKRWKMQQWDPNVTRKLFFNIVFIYVKPFLLLLYLFFRSRLIFPSIPLQCKGGFVLGSFHHNIQGQSHNQGYLMVFVWLSN